MGSTREVIDASEQEEQERKGRVLKRRIREEQLTQCIVGCLRKDSFRKIVQEIIERPIQVRHI
jgi:DNA-directed RNA polymerase alpha subunit